MTAGDGAHKALESKIRQLETLLEIERRNHVTTYEVMMRHRAALAKVRAILDEAKG